MPDLPVPEVTEPLGLRVSVILTAYNQAETLHRAIAALEKSQSRDRLEILVVDCGSQDKSAQMDREFQEIQVLRLPHHLGLARALNIAMRTAKAELVLFLSPNVEVAPDTVSRLADHLEPESDLAAVCPLLADGHGATVSQFRSLPTKDQIGAACEGHSLPSAAPDLSQESIPNAYPGMDALLVRKVFLRGMNYFDQRYGHHWVDAELAMQIYKAGKKIRLYPGIRATYHPASDPLGDDSLAITDRYSGGAAFVGKYYGGGFMMRLGMAFSALARFQFGRASGILTGAKLDGSQAG